MTIEQLNQLINIIASITLFEMMVAIGLGVTFADVLRVATEWRLVKQCGACQLRLRRGSRGGVVDSLSGGPVCGGRIPDRCDVPGRPATAA